MSVISGIAGAVASGEASDAQAKSAEKAVEAQLQMYNQSRADQYPWRTAGTNALNKMSGLMGMGYIPSDTGAASYGQTTNALAGYYQPGAMTTAGGQQGNAPPANEQEYLDMLYKDAEATGDGSKIKRYQEAYKASVAGMVDEQGNPLYFTGQDPKGAWLQSYYDNFVGPYGGVQQQQGQLTPAGASTNALSSQDQARAAEMKSFYTSPGYEFRLGEGLNAIRKGASARGGLDSGATMRAMQRYGEGLAATEYGDYWNRLAAMSGVGQTSVQSTGQLGANTANQMGQAYMNAGDARASGYINQANALSGASSSISNALMYYNMYNKFNAPTTAGTAGGAMGGGSAWGSGAGASALSDYGMGA